MNGARRRSAPPSSVACSAAAPDRHGGRPFATPTVWGDELHGSLVPQPLVEFVAVVGLVSDEPLGQLVQEAVIERDLEDFDLVGRSARDANGDKKTTAVDSCHDLRPLVPLGFSDAGLPF